MPRDDGEKTIAEELKEQQFEVTINFTTGQWKSSRPINPTILRNQLKIFTESLLVGEIMEMVDKGYMRRIGLHKKGN